MTIAFRTCLPTPASAVPDGSREEHSPPASAAPALDASAQQPAIRSWPLLVLAAPAAVAIWSGWVGLGEMTGFGVVHPLPGIWDALRINTAVTLPIGTEAYAAYALRALLARSHQVSRRTRAFAGASVAASLLLGMAGQVAYHLMAEKGITHAPWQITTVVSCLPVLVLGMGAALAHMLRADITCAAGADPAAPGTCTARDQLAGLAARAAEAEVIARRLVAAGQAISRRSLRRAGLRGSNSELGALAAVVRERVSAEMARQGDADLDATQTAARADGETEPPTG